MSKKIVILAFSIISIILLSSCSKAAGNGGYETVMGKEQKADIQMEKIITALKEKDTNSLKLLFSEKALNEVENFEDDAEYLFDFFQGSIITLERDSASVDESIENGKKTSMIRFAASVNTDKENYKFYIIDYSKDTINPDNEGLYMLELRKANTPNTGSWQERMRPGISIIE